MRIKFHKFRNLLGLCPWSIQADWLDELHTQVSEGEIASATWTGIRNDYDWNTEVAEWLSNQPHRSCRVAWRGCRTLDDFLHELQPRIYLRNIGQVTHFKLLFGGQVMPADTAISFPAHKRIIVKHLVSIIDYYGKISVREI